MDKILFLTLLYDFYGELLTQRQKQIFELYYLNDLSMQEIGSRFDITRQSINDLLKRTEKILFSYEEKLSLVKEYSDNRKKVSHIIDYIDDLQNREVAKGTDRGIELLKIKELLEELNL